MGTFNNKKAWTDQMAQQLALTIPGAELLGSWGKATMELSHIS